MRHARCVCDDVVGGLAWFATPQPGAKRQKVIRNPYG